MARGPGDGPNPSRDHVRLTSTRRAAGRVPCWRGRLGRARCKTSPRLGDQASGIGCSPLGNHDQPRVVPGLEFSPAARSLFTNVRPCRGVCPAGQGRIDLGRARARVGEDLDVAAPVDAGLLRPGLLENAVEIAAAESEGADRRAAGMARAAKPGPGFGAEVKRRSPRGQGFDRLAHLDRRRQDLVVERQRGLDQTRRARGRLGVAHLRLDRTQSTP